MARRKGRLLSKAKETNAKLAEQERLKNKHGIEDSDVVVVEKPSTFKYLTKAVGAVWGVAWIIFIYTLAFIGGVSIVYTESREALLRVFDDAAVEAEDVTGIDIKSMLNKGEAE